MKIVGDPMGITGKDGLIGVTEIYRPTLAAAETDPSALAADRGCKRTGWWRAS
ncbi:hypothetical protein [Streptomyces sp. NPDC020489]|uniref:hypothetical protein n=1 Tax=Streptomyces sp. NPDC020489 TaxID=3365077 RepID=UPI00378BE8D4